MSDGGNCPLIFFNTFLKIYFLGNSLVVQWLGLGAFTTVARVQSLVRERRYLKPRGMAKKILKKLLLFGMVRTWAEKPKTIFEKFAAECLRPIFVPSAGSPS